MTRIAYLANSFPEQGEWYVWDEISELRRRGGTVLPCSFRRPREIAPKLHELSSETHYVFPLHWRVVAQAVLLLIKFHLICDLAWRAIRGPESLWRRLRTVLHTALGMYLAAGLRDEKIAHIHVHHGYFAAWAGMVAARLLGASFSMTLHGSDLLVRADYLETKIRSCNFCITVSEFNRDYIRHHYPAIDYSKILVHRLGVDVEFWRSLPKAQSNNLFSILSVGRLHPVKNHEFLIRACHALQNTGVQIQCIIAGEGPERERLQKLICELQLEDRVELRGHMNREQLLQLYGQADAVVLTSRSEGIPLAVMEAMAMERIVLAPAITGIPELISHEKNGFLYQPNSMDDFLTELKHIHARRSELDDLRRAARRRVESNFNRERNLHQFTTEFLRRVDALAEQGELIHAGAVLQQI